MAILGGLSKYKDLGLLILRVGIGVLLITHGYPKLMAGPSGDHGWTKLGGTMGLFGITFAPTFWGFMAAFAEAIGGLLIVLGFFFRPATLLVIINMFVAVYMHVTVIKGGHEPALLFGIVALSLFITGPGRYSIDKK